MSNLVHKWVPAAFGVGYRAEKHDPRVHRLAADSRVTCADLNSLEASRTEAFDKLLAACKMALGEFRYVWLRDELPNPFTIRKQLEVLEAAIAAAEQPAGDPK